MLKKAKWVADTKIPKPDQEGFAENADDIEFGLCCFSWVGDDGRQDAVWCSETDYELVE